MALKDAVELLIGSAARPRRVRVPHRLVTDEIGVGSLIETVTGRVGIGPCGGCHRRALSLDERFILVGAGPPPAPRPGCWFVGTSCYGFIQTLKFCCSDKTEYTQMYGWCFGLVFAPPCLPRWPDGRAHPDDMAAIPRGGG